MTSLHRRIVTALALLLAAPAHADTLVDNVDGFTLTATGAVQRFNGLLVGDDGRIEQIYQRGDKRPARADYRLDGKGRVLMPGLIDGHIDLTALALSLLGSASDKAHPRPEDRDDALSLAQEHLLERGVTTAVDMGTTIEAWQSYRRAGDLGRLRMRIVGYAASAGDMVLIAGPGPTPWLYDDRLRLVGLRIPFAPTLAPAVSPAAVVPLKPAEIQLKNLLSRASIDGFQSAVDLRDPRSMPQLLDALGEIRETYKGDRRWRIDLTSPPDAADLPRLAEMKAAITLRPGSIAIQPTALAGQQSQTSLGTWAPAEPAEPFAMIAASASRQTALIGFTSGAAWAAQAEGRFGRIAVGQQADFLLVDRNPLEVPAEELRSLRVLQTWVGGKLVWQAKEMAPAPAPAAPPPVRQQSSEGGR